MWTILRAASAAPLAFMILACDDLLLVELPARVPAEELDDPRHAELLVNSAMGDFECAYANYVVATGLLTDELIHATGLPAIRSWDTRSVNQAGVWTRSDCTAGIDQTRNHMLGLYTPLQTARFQAESTYEKLEGWNAEQVPERARLLAVSAAYAGYAYVLFGEAFCEATFDGTPVLQPTQVLERARERFTRAIDWAQQSGNDTILNMARVGRARVQLDLGMTSEAAADAGNVQEGFVLNATYSAASPRRRNFVYELNHRYRLIVVDPRFRNLQTDGVPDRRVITESAGIPGFNGRTPLWYQRKYSSESSPIPIASWDEAQLIIAEVEGGQSAVSRINMLREKAGLPAFNSSDPDLIQQQIREERKRELYLEGNRLNDMLRWNLEFDRGPGQPGDVYGPTTCIPLPAIERQ